MRRLVGVGLLFLLAVVCGRIATATSAVALPDRCTVDTAAGAPDRTLGFAAGAEKEPPEGWTESAERAFDWDGDGGPDQLVFGPSSASVRWATGSLTVTGLTGAAADLGRADPRPAAVADLTGDTRPDLVTVDHGRLRVLVGDGDPTWLDTNRSIDVADIGSATAPGWTADPAVIDGLPGETRRIPYDRAGIRPLWDLTGDGVDDVAVVSPLPRSAGPTARYAGRPCAELATDDRAGHAAGRPVPDSLGWSHRTSLPRSLDTTAAGSTPGTGTGTTGGTVIGSTITWETTTTTTLPPGSGRAAVSPGSDMPDPDVIREGTRYYLYNTNSAAWLGDFLNVPVWTAEELWWWEPKGDALPDLPSWAVADAGFVWAPTVHKFGSTYHLYFTARTNASMGWLANRMCIGHATSSNPLGPFVDDSTQPFFCQYGKGGSIDADIEIGITGVPWMLVKSEGCCGEDSRLWVQQLSADGSALVGDPRPQLDYTAGWETPRLEAPSMATADGKTYLFYSGGDWDDDTYAIGVGQCGTVSSSPCTKLTQHGPWYQDNHFVTGPGGQDLFQDYNGQWWMVYHGWYDGISGYENGGHRALWMEQIDFGPYGPVPDESAPYTSALPAVKNPVRNLGAATGNGSVTVWWDPPVGETPIMGYSVDLLFTDLGYSWSSGSSGDRTTVTLFGIPVDEPFTVTVRAEGRGGSGPSTSVPGQLTARDVATRYHPLDPARVLDTRDGTGRSGPGHLGPGQTTVLDLAGKGGLPAEGEFDAVVLNLTVTDPSESSHLRVWPANMARPPESSSINFRSGETRAVSATVSVDPDGRVRVFNNSGTVHVIADLVGYYRAGPDGARHHTAGPVRVLDTRDGTGRAPVVTAPVSAGETINLPLAGTHGLPAAAELSAVVLNLTATNPTADSHLRVWPGGSLDPPDASTLNFRRDQTVANLTVARVGADGSINIFNNSGATHVIADLVGWYGAPGGTTGSEFHPTVPYRFIDTRQYMGPVRAGVPFEVFPSVPMSGGGPGQSPQPPSAIVATLTIDQPTDGSHLTAWPTGITRPGVSNLNFSRGDTIANMADLPIGWVIYRYGPNNEFEYRYPQISFANNTGSVHLIGDLNGYFGAEEPVSPGP